MIHNEFKYLLQSVRYSSRKHQDSALKEILTSIQKVHEEDLQDLFDLLNHTNDMELQVKLFSILAAHLLSNNDSNSEVIVTYRPLYDRVQEVLSGGLSHRTTTTLNFVTALLSVYSDDESPSPRRKSLALFARNMTRISGCLATMSKMFTSCMMYQDTWLALCHCLAEACRGSEINQNYCTHLIPMCVIKCQQVSVEVCALLQSLLHNNDRNIQVFLDNDGLTIFTRELLQDSSCMQLLNTILCKSTQAVNLLRVTRVPQLLGGFVHSYGSLSQIGQWAKVILHYFDSRLRIQSSKIKLMQSDIVEDLNMKSLEDEKFAPDKRSVQGQYSPDETTKLYQNVIREIISWKAQNNPRMKNPPNDSFRQSDKLTFNCEVHKNVSSSNVVKHWMPKNYGTVEKDRIVPDNSNVSKDLSFSFLLRQDFRNPSKNGDRVRSMNKSITNNVTTQTDAMDIMFTDIERSRFNFQNGEINSTHESVVFAPIRASTPKNKQSSFNKTASSKISRISCSKSQKNYKRRKLGIQKPKKREEKHSMQELKNTSFSSRLFSAINDSCTTLVKSVKSIFKPKENKETEKRFSNNSFTNYMRRRDALLKGECTKTENTDYEDFSTEKSDINSCRTCDDTIILKHKLANDEYLKQTVKKIKLGINLYGCDFKKISMAMWPQEKYMTPTVLYNLYRKLIVKNIDF